MKHLAAIAGLLATSLAAVLQAAQQPAVFQSETQMVLVDVFAANKKGEFVRDLTAKNFRVWEDNKEQTIRSFSLDAGNDPRRVLLFFDNTSGSVTDQVAARRAAANFIAGNAGPSRPMAVVSLDDSFHIAQAFTENAARLKDALNSVNISNVAQGSGNQYQGVLLETLSNLARTLKSLPGRKALVLFTASSALAGTQPQDLANLVQIFNRSDIAVYPVLATPSAVADPSGARDGGGRTGRGGGFPNRVGTGQDDNLPYTLAARTGGFVVPPSSEILPQLQKIGAEQSQSYVLGYSPPEGAKPESCHALRVKADVSGVTLRVRSGYCASKPQDLLAASRVEQDLEKHAASASGTAPAAGISAAVQAPFFYNSPNVARVHVVMEIPTQGLKFADRKVPEHAAGFHLEINVLGIASNPDGSVAARFSDIVQRDFDAAVPPNQTLHYEKEFKIAPGQYHLNIAFSSGGAAFGTAGAALSIPPRDAARLTVSALALGRQIQPAAELGLEASLLDSGTPLIAGGQQLIPTGSNVFTRAQPAYCYFEVYTPGASDSPTLHLRIVNRTTGTVAWDGGDAKPGSPNVKSMIPVGLNLPIASLAPGPYRLELTAAGDGDQFVQRSLEFEIK